jgi:circadian clock protein KaiB
MNTDDTVTSTGDTASGTPEFVLHLFVSGQTLRSNRAIVNVRNLCEQQLKGRYELKVVDVLLDPRIAAAEQLIALPTLVKKFPKPTVRFIGDLSDTERILSRIMI